MHFKLLNPSKYLQATDFEAADWKFGREPTFTITQVGLEKMEGEKKDETKMKGMLLLAEQPKGWVMNVTNAKCLAAMFGDETNAWMGKRVTLCSEKVFAFGEWTLGVRVRGSPDLDAPKSVTVKLRKKTHVIDLVKTSAPANGKPVSAPPPFVPDGTIRIGPKKGAQLAQLTHDELAAGVALGKKQIAEAKPGALWVPNAQAHVDEMLAEQARRAELEQRMSSGQPPPGAESEAPPPF